MSTAILVPTWFSIVVLRVDMFTNDQINAAVLSCYYSIKQLCSIRLTRNALLNAANAIVISRINYCNGLCIARGPVKMY